VWSAAPAPDLAGRMRSAGFSVEIHEVRASRGRGARHAVVAGRRLSAARMQTSRAA
jgi:hypothetical protein